MSPFDRVRAALAEIERETAFQAKNLQHISKDLERERIRLAVCGVVAMCDTPEAAARSRDMRQEYFSASCGDVIRRVEECIRLRKECDELRAKLANRDQIIAECAAAVGVLVSPECSDEFRAMLPGEIRGKLAKSSPMYSAELSAAMQALKSVQQERDSLKAKLAACERQEPKTLPIDVHGKWYEVPIPVQLHVIQLRDKLAECALRVAAMMGEQM